MSGIWMDVDAALAEVPVNAMPLVSDSDFKTIQTSVAYNASGMALTWHFVTTAGAYSATSVTPTTGGTYDWAHQAQGMYSIEIPASGGASINNDTEGFGWFTGVAAGVLPWRGPTIGFRAAALNDALIDNGWSATRGLAGTALPNAAADAPGGLPVSDAGGLDLDTQLGKLVGTIAAGAHQPQTGDSYVIVDSGTHGNAALKSLIDAVKAVADAVKLKTDNLPGDPADASDVAAAFGVVGSAIAALNDLSSVESQAAAAAALTAYGAAQSGDEMDLVNAPNVTAIVAIQDGLSTHSAADVWSATGRTLSGTLGSFDAIWAKIKAWLRLTLRNDAPIAADHAAELAEINQNMGTGAGTYDPTANAQQAPVNVTLTQEQVDGIVDGVVAGIGSGLEFPTAGDIAAELAGNNVVATFPLLIEGEETVIIQGEDYFDADGNAATVTITAMGIESAVTDGWDFVFWGHGDSTGQVVAGSPSSGGANTITVKFDLPAAKTSLVTAGLGGWRVVHKPATTTRRFSEVEGLLRVKPTK